VVPKRKTAPTMTMEHTRGVLGQYFGFLKQTLSSYPSGGTELGEKLKAYAEKNIATAHEYLDKLSHAKALQGVVQIPTEFMQVQLNALANRPRVSVRGLQRQQQMWSRSRSKNLDEAWTI